jgi:2-keto-4-pentenoate hydratase/2-oxohepta-3-ene-1,7-dioic acid hydratase in catechol pathway
MRLVRYRNGDAVAIGAIKGEGIVDLVGAGSRWTTIRAIIEGGSAALDDLGGLIEACATSISLEDAELLAPIERPGKYLAIGMNYGKHLEEADKLGVARAKHQIWFNKQTSCISGPYSEIDPGVTDQLDYEVELGVVIGRAAKGVTEAQAPTHVFGYLIANDISARDWQFHSTTFTMGKSFDTHGPIGPWIVTADEIPDPHALGLRCFVNGEKRQDSSTSQMIANVWAQIAYLSTAFTLEPGDLLATGTPEGVGIGMQPPTFLREGDVVRCEIDNIGVIENRVKA